MVIIKITIFISKLYFYWWFLIKLNKMIWCIKYERSNLYYNNYTIYFHLVCYFSHLFYFSFFLLLLEKLFFIIAFKIISTSMNHYYYHKIICRHIHLELKKNQLIKSKDLLSTIHYFIQVTIHNNNYNNVIIIIISIL